MTDIVAKELRLARIDKGLTIAEASIKAGIDDTTISAYENNKRKMDLNIVCQLVETYGLTPKIFFDKVIAKTQ